MQYFDCAALDTLSRLRGARDSVSNQQSTLLSLHGLLQGNSKGGKKNDTSIFKEKKFRPRCLPLVHRVSVLTGSSSDEKVE